MDQEVDRLFTIVEIAQHFHLPESTCRYYCKRFGKFIDCVGDGRRRRYRRSALDVIAAILEEMKQAKTAAAVEKALGERFPSTQLAVHEATEVLPTREVPSSHADSQQFQPFPPAALTFLERQTVALEGIAKMLGMLATHFCSTPQLPHTQSSSLLDLQKEVSRLAILLDSSEKMQQADIDQIRTWLHHFARKISPQRA
ncbi:MAG: MerR family transcriptional regulator [Desulfovibrio sp.]|nr:MerR family transcriptional regulator [Desulfovibrio sp.]